MSDNLYQAPTTQVANPGSHGPPPTLKQKLFSVNGRFSRSQYWGYGVLGSALFGILAAIPYFILIFALISADEAGKDPNIALVVVLGILTFLLYIPAVWVSFVAAAKRFHDRGKTGWMSLIALIPYVGGIWILVECGCLVGTAGTNAYGPDPLAGRY